MGGMVTWLAHALGFQDLCEACEVVDTETALDIQTLKNFKFLSGHEGDDRFLWKVDGQAYRYLPSTEITSIGDNFNRWVFPKEGEEEDDDDDEGGDDDEEEGDDHDDDDDEGEDDDQTMQEPSHTQNFPSHHPYGAGSSSTPSSFDPYQVFPPSYFGSSTTPPPPPPRDPYDLTPMYQMLGALHQYRADDRAYMEDTRRIVWHDHLGLVKSGLVPCFANHPSHPPDFDLPHLPLQQFPQYFPPNHPYYRPPPPNDP